MAERRNDQLATPIQIDQIIIKSDLAQKTGNISSGFFQNFMNLVSDRYTLLKSAIFGDKKYQKRNQFNFQQKSKILAYLKIKNMNIHQELEEAQSQKFFDFDPQFSFQNPTTIEEFKNTISKAKQNFQAAKRQLNRLELTAKSLKANYLNEQGYQFDKQRYNSMIWGLILGSLICGTYYRHSKAVRQLALVLFCGHVFGQINYKANMDRYFDSVYKIFEEEAVKFSIQQKLTLSNTKIGVKTDLIN